MAAWKEQNCHTCVLHLPVLSLMWLEINYKLQPLVTGQAGLQETCEVLMKLQVAADYCRLQDLGIPLSYHFNPCHLLCLLAAVTSRTDKLHGKNHPNKIIS